MKSNQTLSILFWHRKSKADSNGYAPIICRLTIDGLEEEFSTAKKVVVDGWDVEAKKAVAGKDFKTVNSALDTIRISLESYFLVLRTQHACITPLMLKNVYKNIEPELEKTTEQPKTVAIPFLLELTESYILEFEELVNLKKRSKETLKQWRAT
ncbi:MAG: Arm DNA-binding domain-containing protein, partial [Pedobacter sp.]|nr:Arm DNA-binding domain-containing protein [Pedobacter sp.]